MGHLGVVLYEYLGEEYPEVLGSILGALKVCLFVLYLLYFKAKQQIMKWFFGSTALCKSCFYEAFTINIFLLYLYLNQFVLVHSRADSPTNKLALY